VQGPEPPQPRDWIVLDDSDSPSDEKFQVVSFNILCKLAATPQQFGYTPSRALSWDYRKEIILEELRKQDADIICLQEMDSDNYHNLFRETLARSGYKGVFWPRAKSRTMTPEQQKQVDGCATFIRDSKYVLHISSLILGDAGLIVG
jgi:CCR4-NOT transcription complex subunit 6